MRVVSIWRHLFAIAVLPGMVTIVVPSVILHAGGRVEPGGAVPPPWGTLGALAGCALVGLGLILGTAAVFLFARIGRGTLAPWDPTRRLVVHGPYRYVRNPMISGVLAVLFGEAAFFGSFSLFLWFLLFLGLNLIYIPFWEEPDLERRLGPEYVAYRQNVPRWVPRLTPWKALRARNADPGDVARGSRARDLDPLL
jgi:protein-S-isoprenylcysteine O-methyltransferase Ste14